MRKIKIGCETYTWQMPGEMYKGKLDHIMGICNKAGFVGIEPETSFFGNLSDPLKMKETLQKHEQELAVLVHVEDWRNPRKRMTKKNGHSNGWIFYPIFPKPFICWSKCQVQIEVICKSDSKIY